MSPRPFHAAAGRACAALVLGALTVASHASTFEMPTRQDFVADDGWLDVSRFLDRAYGFIPVLMPITEPAVGYGVAGALLFVDRRGEPGSDEFKRPNLAAVGGLRTENGTNGYLGGYSGRWLDGRLQTTAGLADATINLDFYPAPDVALGYSAKSRGGMVEGKYRLGASDWWAGLRYIYADVSVTFDSPALFPPELLGDRETRLGGASAIVTYDGRDNLFTPTSGLFLDVSYTAFAEALGGDRNFQRADLIGLAFHPLGRDVYFGVKGGARWSSDGTPFYLRPFVQLRGVQAMRYQGTETAEVEAELRWQFHPRFSLVGFGGVGVAGGRASLGGERETVAAGGAGFRYLVAQSYGMHMGIDVARSPDQTVIYVVLGNAWFRP